MEQRRQTSCPGNVKTHSAPPALRCAWPGHAIHGACFARAEGRKANVIVRRTASHHLPLEHAVTSGRVYRTQGEHVHARTCCSNPRHAAPFYAARYRDGTAVKKTARQLVWRKDRTP